MSSDQRKCLNMVWANESGVSVYILEGEHGRRVIEIHRVNEGGYEEVAITATIEKHNRAIVAECFTDTKEERMEKFIKRFNVSDDDLDKLAKIKPPIQSNATEES